MLGLARVCRGNYFVNKKKINYLIEIEILVESHESPPSGSSGSESVEIDNSASYTCHMILMHDSNIRIYGMAYNSNK